MVGFDVFVSVFAEKCGGGADRAAPVWNANKEAIREMSRAEVEDALRCPDDRRR